MSHHHPPHSKAVETLTRRFSARLILHIIGSLRGSLHTIGSLEEVSDVVSKGVRSGSQEHGGFAHELPGLIEDN